MQRTTVQAILLCLAVCSLFACNNKQKTPPVQPAAQVMQTPVLQPQEPTPADPLQAEIDELTQEIADLEDSYPPVSALWPENSDEKESFTPPLVINRLENGLVEIPRDHCIAREKSFSERILHSNHKAEVVSKKLRLVTLQLRQEIAQEEAEMAEMQKIRDDLTEFKAQLENSKAVLQEAREQIQEKRRIIKEERRKYNLPE